MLEHNPQLYVDKWLWHRRLRETGLDTPNPIWYSELIGIDFDKFDPDNNLPLSKIRALLIDYACSFCAGHGLKVAAAFAAWDEEHAADNHLR